MAAVKKVKFLGERPEISFRNILFYMTKVTKIIVWRRFEPPFVSNPLALLTIFLAISPQ